MWPCINASVDGGGGGDAVADRVDDVSYSRGFIAPQLALAHVHPQVDESHDAFLAVERLYNGTGWFRIRRHGMEKWFGEKPPRVADVDLNQGLDRIGNFQSPVWRRGDAAKGAGVLVAVQSFGGLGLLCA